MKTWLIAASAIGGIYAPGMILLDAAISKKNIGVDGMPEYIEKGNALFLLGNLAKEPAYQHDGEDYYVGICEASGVINEIQPVDVAPVRHGKWLPTRKWWQGGSAWKQCSECSRLHLGKPNYCKYCGALMDL